MSEKFHLDIHLFAVLRRSKLERISELKIVKNNFQKLLVVVADFKYLPISSGENEHGRGGTFP